MVNISDLNRFLAQVGMEGTNFIPGTTAQLEKDIQVIWSHLRAWVGEFENAAAFQRHWVRARLFVPLQIRLAMEQLLWELGGGYRNLITGFGPARDVGNAVSGSGAPSERYARSSRVPYPRGTTTSGTVKKKKKRRVRRHRY